MRAVAQALPTAGHVPNGNRRAAKRSLDDLGRALNPRVGVYSPGDEISLASSRRAVFRVSPMRGAEELTSATRPCRPPAYPTAEAAHFRPRRCNRAPPVAELPAGCPGPALRRPLNPTRRPARSCAGGCPQSMTGRSPSVDPAHQTQGRATPDDATPSTSRTTERIAMPMFLRRSMPMVYRTRPFRRFACKKLARSLRIAAVLPGARCRPEHAGRCFGPNRADR